MKELKDDDVSKELAKEGYQKDVKIDYSHILELYQVKHRGAVMMNLTFNELFSLRGEINRAIEDEISKKEKENA